MKCHRLIHLSVLCELIQSSSALAEHASTLFAAFKKETDRSSEDDHMWFTNTTLYCAWVDPPVGAPTSPFLCCSTKDISNCGFAFWGQSRMMGNNIFYFDCRDGEKRYLAEKKGVSKYPILTSNIATLLLWSIVAQGLHDRCGSTEVRICIWECLRTDPMVFMKNRTDHDARKAVLEAFERLLSAVIDLRKDKELIVVIDHVDQLSGESLSSMIIVLNQLREIMDLPLATKLRYLLVGKVTRENQALQGVVVIDEDTEYHGKL